MRAATAHLADLSPDDVSVVMFGSWARRELTDGSDNDWAILTPEGRPHDDDVQELAAHCRARFNEGGKAPGAQDMFGVAFPWSPLAQHVGLDDDTNTNLTRRMLMLLESVALTGSVRDQCWTTILERYLEHGVKDHWPPRFLLNDTIRYWRTICVDFEGKHATGGDDDDPKWGLLTFPWVGERGFAVVVAGRVRRVRASRARSARRGCESRRRGG